MAATKLSLAQHAIDTATKNYLAGVAFAVAFRMQGMVKSVEARDLIDKASDGSDAITLKAVKSLQQAISNQWNFGGEVLAKLSSDDRKSILACGDNGMMKSIVKAMQDHMAMLGFNAFTLGNLKEFYGFNSAQEIEDHKAMMAAKEAEMAATPAATPIEWPVPAPSPVTASEATAKAVAAGKPERNIVTEAMAILDTASRQEALDIICKLSAKLDGVDIAGLISDWIGDAGHDELQYITDLVKARKAAIVAVNATADADTRLANHKAKRKA